MELWLGSVLGRAMVWRSLGGIDVMLLVLTELLGNFPTFFFFPAMKNVCFFTQNV